MPNARTIYLLSRLHYALRQRIEQALADKKLSAVQYTILSMLKGRNQLSSADIARRYFVKPQSMNEIVFSLQKRGLIERSEDKNNKRVLRISLTGEGSALLEECDAIVDELEKDVLKCVDPQELASFRGVLDRVLSDLRSSRSE